jgi:hypothetical protein
MCTPDSLARFWAKVEKTDTCWLWRGALHHKGGGYGLAAVEGKLWRAHRFTYELAYGAIPDGLHVAHHCDTPACVRPDHLFLTTPRGNRDDRIAKGREGHKLTERDVRLIRLIYPTRIFTQKEIAAYYGVHQGHISDVVNGRTWRYLLTEGV